ncbi:MAG TPA: ATP phosphoribosyltransferase regulatory subunit, partial [Lachnospiraceae bacterium]|nr:ATP phosphoribosyltransferase regulatory subunit [Lachnospiraceae bacterium]
ELINDGSPEADAEMVSLIIACMKQAGLHDFQVSIGNVEFFKGLCMEYGIDEDAEMELREMISNKNYFGAQEILDSLSLSDEIKETILKITEMFGPVETIREAKKIVTNKRSLLAVSRLEAIHEILEKENTAEYVTFDLGMLSKYHYYTGVIFRAYTYGTGDAVIKGGRYDSLLREFGKKTEAIGFAVVVDHLLSALSRQEIPVETKEETFLMLYKQKDRDKAYKKAKEYREKGKKTILMRMDQDEHAADYGQYAEMNHFHIILVEHLT